jgi:hypothetical protein
MMAAKSLVNSSLQDADDGGALNSGDSMVELDLHDLVIVRPMQQHAPISTAPKHVRYSNFH